MKLKVVTDLSHLPTYAFGTKTPMWWGTVGFVVLEGTGFALASGTYLYLAYLNADWPLSAPLPRLAVGTSIALLLIASILPNMWLDRAAHSENLRRVRIGLVLLSIIGIAAVILRIYEFGSLQVRWDTNAYGSIVWVVLALHTAHLLTDLGDTLVLTALMFTRHGHGKRFSDVADNAFYWNFVVLSWVPLYGLIYWFPRL
jgi:heme/copper-type cytochrome/quinol oxidase subunit 3